MRSAMLRSTASAFAPRQFRRFSTRLATALAPLQRRRLAGAYRWRSTVPDDQKRDPTTLTEEEVNGVVRTVALAILARPKPNDRRILGLNPTEVLTTESVEEAFRQRRLLVHPEKTRPAGLSDAEAREAFERLAPARDTLLKELEEEARLPSKEVKLPWKHLTVTTLVLGGYMVYFYTFEEPYLPPPPEPTPTEVLRTLPDGKYLMKDGSIVSPDGVRAPR